MKVKARLSDEFLIAGYVPGEKSRSTFGSLVLAKRESDGTLTYAGNVGTGFTGAEIDRLLALLEPLRRERPPFAAELGDVDVFRTPATDLVALVSRKTSLDPSSHDPGVTFEFPTIGLGFWRESREEGPFFETVYVSPPQP